MFGLAADRAMEDIGTVASLFKSIPIDDFWPTRIIYNQLFFGFLSNQGGAVILIEKRALLDPAVSPEETERRLINLEVDGWRPNACMNTTCLVFGQDQREQGKVHTLLVKKDFWMSNNEF